jgi:alkyl sulfatase BDS1-like metallo-beta-lactamase superfamily hydrolase
MELRKHLPAISALAALLLAADAGVEVPSDVEERVDALATLPVESRKIGDGIFKIDGPGAIFLINTPDGSVLIDTGIGGESSAKQRALFDELAAKPLRRIILTHFHTDHIGGLPLWEKERAAGAELVAHHRFAYMARIQREATPFFLRRYDVIYPDQVDETQLRPPAVLSVKPDREVQVGQDYVFELGGVEFRVIAMDGGGEGEDGLMVWLPQSRALFVGDLFGALYPMFPNLYTVRGEKYRDPLDYIESLDRVLALDPRILAPSHAKFMTDPAYVRASVTRQRDAVQYVWDRTLAAMNAGRTVWQAMEEIRLPPELALSQGHGKVSWSVRGIWELVTGWYHYETVADLYALPPSAIYADLVELAGGADRIAERAQRYLDEQRPLPALRLLDLVAGTETPLVLEKRLTALELLLDQARPANNYSEIGLLEADMRRTKLALSRCRH